MEERKQQRLPIWDGPRELMDCMPDFVTGMADHSPFVYTASLERSDLGQCIISMQSPRYVAKVRMFRTCAELREDRTANEKQRELAARADSDRMAWIEQRQDAWDNEVQAEEQEISVKELKERQGYTYDEEFDEPRLVAKVPGMNVYLELLGCLDDIDSDTLDWSRKAKDGPYAALQQMTDWAKNIWQRKGRRPFASNEDDQQPVIEWHENYDPDVRFWKPKKRGIGLEQIDPSRRPELQYAHIANPDREDLHQVKMMKQAAAEVAMRHRRKK